MLPSEEEIAEADVIIGVNKETGSETLFYGTSLLTLIKHGYEEQQEIEIQLLRVPLDVDDTSEEPEKLAVLCLAIKGSCDALTPEEG